MEKDIPTISVVDPGCLSRIRRSRVIKIPVSGSASKNLNNFEHKLFLSSRKYDPGMFFLDPDLDFLPIPDPGVKKAPIPDLDPQHCLPYYGLKSPYSLVLQPFFDIIYIIYNFFTF
jgi:hypothetical protein